MSAVDYSTYHSDQDGTHKGIIMSRLEAKLVEIRSYRINWESYHQGEMITKTDYQFISHYDRQKPDEKLKLFETGSEQCILTMLSLASHVAKDHVIQYTVVMIDDILSNNKENVKQFHDVANKHSFNMWAPLISLLNRDDAVIMHMASRLIAKLATFSKYHIPQSDLAYYLSWLKVQLSVQGNEYLQSVAECLQWMLRVDAYRMPFVKADGLNSIVSVLLSKLGFQLQYQLIFAIWMLSFQPNIAAIVGENNVIPVLSDIMRNSQKEKVTRIIIATFRNLLEKPEENKTACVSIIQSKLLPVFDVLSGKTWGDEDIKEDIEYITEQLQLSVQDLSTWDEYVAEVRSGRLEWSPVHRQEKFWRENAIKVAESNYELLKMLVRLLESNDDPIIKAVACHDLGEFIRHYPRGKAAFDQLGCKELIMRCMNDDDANVKYEALISVQKLLVHNWEFLGKQIKVE